MLDPRLSGALSRMHHDILDLTELVKELQKTVNEIKESLMVEFELASDDDEDDEESESESSQASAQTI